MAQVKKARSSNLLGRFRRLRCGEVELRATAVDRRGSGDGAEGALGAGRE
jgi:hypothetical protein